MNDLSHTAEHKKKLRKHYKLLLKGITDDRRKEASSQLLMRLSEKLSSYKQIVSFVSLQEEINTNPLNDYLLTQKALALFRLSGNELIPHKIEDMKTLVKNSFGILEPLVSSPILLDFEIECILVPALCFDTQYFRLGRGMGHFDRLIARLHSKGYFPKLIGIGFKEQLHETLLPIAPFDQPLEELALI